MTDEERKRTWEFAMALDEALSKRNPPNPIRMGEHAPDCNSHVPEEDPDKPVDCWSRWMAKP